MNFTNKPNAKDDNKKVNDLRHLADEVLSNRKDSRQYSYYSRVLKEPFDSVEELNLAEKAYYDKLKAKEDKVNQKKADAAKVEAAFKALNDTRRAYKEELAQLTKEYVESLEALEKTFKFGKKDIQKKLAAAEDVYADALKAFTDKYPEGYHLTLKDSDFETTISKQTSGEANKTSASQIFDLFNILFGI